MEKMRQIYVGAMGFTVAGLVVTFLVKLLFMISERRIPFPLAMMRYSLPTLFLTLFGAVLLLGGTGLFTALTVLQKQEESADGSGKD